MRIKVWLQASVLLCCCAPIPLFAWPIKQPLDESQFDPLAEKKREEALGYLQRVVPRIDDDNPQKADLTFQLSELYSEKAKFLYRQEIEAYDHAYQLYETQKKQGVQPSEPHQNHQRSEASRQDAMRLLQQLLGKFPGYPRRDEVLFALGYNLYEIGKKAEAIAQYQELMRSYPASKFAPDTYIQLGDYYFDEVEDLAKARAMYNKALLSKAPKIHSYALYKLAWCDYNDGNYDTALKSLQQVVNYANTRGREMVDLKNEALNDLVVVYVRSGKVDEAIAYFNRESPSRAFKLTSKLAAALAEAGLHDGAIQTFKSLLEKAPLHPDAPEFQHSIVKSYEELRERDKVALETGKLISQYGPASTWWEANRSNPAAQRNAYDMTEEALRTLAVDYHQEAQKTKQTKTYHLARDLYKQYLSAYGSSTDLTKISDSAFNVRFYYAEVLWALQEWQQAAQQYDAVAEMKIPDRPTAKAVSQPSYRATAAYNAILGYDKLLRIERGQKPNADDDGGFSQKLQTQVLDEAHLQSEPLTPSEGRLVKACDRYVKLVPHAKDEIEVRYLAAVTFYERHQFDQAAKRFEEIIGGWPEDRRSQQAAELSMHMLESKKEWLKLNQTARQYSANPKLCGNSSEFCKHVATVVEGSQFKWIDEVVYRQEKNSDKALEELNRFIREHPRSAHTDRALTYAVVIYQGRGDNPRAVRLGERILKDFPQSPFIPKILYDLAVLYEKSARFDRSADSYESFVVNFDREKKRAGDTPEEIALVKEASEWVPDAVFNAALWRESLGQSDRALDLYSQYLARFGERKDAPQVFYGLGFVLESEKKWKLAAELYESFRSQYSKDPRVGPKQLFTARCHRWVNKKRQKDESNSKKVDPPLAPVESSYGQLSDLDRKDTDVIHAYAQVRFMALEESWEEFRSLKFDHLSRVSRDLKAKTKHLKKLEGAYTQVLGLGDGEYGIAALARIGFLYADFANDLLSSPNPPHLTEDQLQMYRDELGNRAFPLEEKSNEALAKAVNKSSELATYPPVAFEAQEQINKFHPGTFPTRRVAAFKIQDLELHAAPLERPASK